MLAKIVGDVNMFSAAVLVSIFSMLTIVGSIWFAKRRSRVEIDNDFQLAKIKQENDTAFSEKKLDNAYEENKFKLETERIVKMGQVEKGLITSHRRSSNRNESNTGDDE